MNATTMQAEHGGGLLSPHSPLVSPDPDSAFLFHPFLLTPVPSSSRLSLGHAKQWRRGKNWTDEKERIAVSLGSQCSSSELPIFISGPSINSFSSFTPLPHPQRLAPVVVLRLAVGFVQALARTPRMPSWRGYLLRSSVWGSMEMCGRWWRAIAIW